MDGYSINLGFHAMRIWSLILNIAADLTWYCTKYAGEYPMAQRYESDDSSSSYSPEWGGLYWFYLAIDWNLSSLGASLGS